MSLFKKAENRQAFLKAGIMGLAGAGKTYTATDIAIGLVEHMRARKLPLGNLPVAFMDTETGSDWALPKFQAAGIELLVSRSRALVDLRNAIKEAEQTCSVLIIDSITHFWAVFCDEYAKRKNRTRGLEFADWAFLKKEWRVFTDLFVNSNLHIIMCGRAGYEYDFFTNENGKKELEKTGIKMKAETETGYEPSLLVLMELEQEMRQGDVESVYRVAKIMKDRSTFLDGKRFTNPTFKDFLPHIECLNLGGEQGAIEPRDNGALFTGDGRARWEAEKQERECCLEEIAEVIKKHHSGQTKDAQATRGDLMEKHFGTRAWSRIESLAIDALKTGRNKLWIELEGVPYAFVPPADGLDGDDLPFDRPPESSEAA